MEFAVLSDTHYISRRMIADPENKELMLQPAVTEQAVMQAAEEADVLLITGDLTDRGDRYSHEDFCDFLRKMKSNGKKINVIFATHDFNHHKAFTRKFGEKVRYKSEPWTKPWFNGENIRWHDYVTDEFSDLSEDECAPQLVESLCPEEIWEMYREFGPDEAYSVHESSFSYCVDLDENTRCLMLNDSFRNEECLNDKSASYSPSCFRWIEKMYNEAKRDGKFIFACSHHPLVPPAPAYRIGAGKENRDMRSPVPGHTLADIGINLAFTGHTHFCDVGYVKSEKGNMLCDITVPSVRFYPPSYRLIDLDGTAGKIKYNCAYINTPQGFELEEESLFEHYHRKMYNQYYCSITGSNAALKKIFDNVKVKDIYFLVKNKAGLSESEYSKIKNIKIFDLIIEIAFNMLIGDGRFTPDTPEYKFMMSLCAKLDSIIDTQPFIDIRKKYLGGYSVSQVIEPMLYNKSVPDREAEIDFTEMPINSDTAPVYTSHAGEAIMGFVYAAAILFSALYPAAAVVGIPLLTVRKKLKEKKNPSEPILKYWR